MLRFLISESLSSRRDVYIMPVLIKPKTCHQCCTGLVFWSIRGNEPLVRLELLS